MGLSAVGTGVAPTGTFTIMQGINQVGGAFTLTPPTPVSFAGTQLPTTVPAGSDTLNFIYSGDANYNGSPAYAASVGLTVNQDAPTLVSFTASPEPQRGWLAGPTFTVTLRSPQTGTPTGTR